MGAHNARPAQSRDRPRDSSISKKFTRRASSSLYRSRAQSSSTGKLQSHNACSDNNIAVQDLDIYFIKQIAKSLNEYDIEQKIDFEIKMREGTQKLLAACKHASQTLEAEKSLLVSNKRINAFMAELQRRRAAERVESADRKSVHDIDSGGRKAMVSISDIRIPLIWKDSDHFKNKGDYRRFAVFGLVRIGAEIRDTVSLNFIDRNVTDISFDDVFVFSNVGADFECQLELYSHPLVNDLTIASASKKLTQKISSSITKTLGRKLAKTVRNELNWEMGSNFNLIASATLTLSEASDAIKTHDLVAEKLEDRNCQLPLFGHFCCRLAVRPDSQSQETMSGYIRVKELTARANKVESIYWASLRNFQLRLWRKKNDIHRTNRVYVRKLYDSIKYDLVIPITSKTKLNSGSDALTIQNEDKGYVLSNAFGFGAISQWSASIESAIQDHLVWQPVAEQSMQILSPSPTRTPKFAKSATVRRSLYDQTSISDTFAPQFCYNIVVTPSHRCLLKV